MKKVIKVGLIALIAFTLGACGGEESITTVTIGNQVWMAKNLNDASKGGKCYEDKAKNCKKYGRLYTWEEATKACPEGFYLPNNRDWQMLVDFAGGDKVAGGKLKAKSGWNEDGNGTDDYGFSALPGGEGKPVGSFDLVGIKGYWWSATEYNARLAYNWFMGYDFSGVAKYDGDKSYLVSVRCIKGKPELDSDGSIGDMLGGLMGNSTGGTGTKVKTPSARDIDMGSDASRSKAEIMQVVNARMPGLRNIYNKYLKEKPGFSGKITLKFTIASSGEISSTNIVSSTTNYSDFDNAIKNMVATWKWKAIEGGNTTPTIPFNFEE